MLKLFNSEYNIRTVLGEIVGTRTKRNALSAMNTNWAFFLTDIEAYEIFLSHENLFRPWLPTPFLEACELAYLLAVTQWDVLSYLASLIYRVIEKDGRDLKPL